MAEISDDLLEEIRQALSPFPRFLAFLKALEELGEFEKPLTAHTCVAQVMGGGGSDYIWVEDLQRAGEVLEKLPKIIPVVGCESEKQPPG